MAKKSEKSISKKEESSKEELKRRYYDGFDKLLESSTKEVTHYVTYIGFGILIAIFNMDKNFLSEYKTIVIITSLLSFTGLFNDYFHSQITIWQSLRGSEEDDLAQITKIYDSLRHNSICFFKINIFILLLAVLLFLYLNYGYFFIWNK